MKVSRAIIYQMTFVLMAIVICIAALAIYESHRFDALKRRMQTDITDQGALAHAIVQYGTDNPDVRVHKFELCKTCRFFVEYGDWYTAWHFTMRVESKAGVEMIAVRARRAFDNSWLVYLKQA